MALYMYILNDCVKVGYTTNFEDRKRSYNTHNPMAELIDMYEAGTEQQEKEIHKYMNQDNRVERINKTEWYKVLDKKTLQDMREEKLSFWQCVNEDELYPNFAIEIEYEEEIIPARDARARSIENILESDEYKSFKRSIIREIDKEIDNGGTACVVSYDVDEISFNIRRYMTSLLKEQGYVIDDDCRGEYKIYW